MVERNPYASVIDNDYLLKQMEKQQQQEQQDYVTIKSILKQKNERPRSVSIKDFPRKGHIYSPKLIPLLM